MNAVLAAVATVALVLVAGAGSVAPLIRRRPIPAFPVEAEDVEEVPRRRAGSAGAGRIVPAWAAWTVVLGAVLAAVVPNLASSLAPRTESEPMTGTAPAAGAVGAVGSVATLEAAVRADPTDVRARLALADRYLELRRLGDAAGQYLAVLRLDPSNAPARASLGLVLYLSGRPAGGLRAVRSAIRADPSYAPARLFEGVILFRGLHRPAAAAAALREFLRGVDSGPQARMARRLLADIEAA